MRHDQAEGVGARLAHIRARISQREHSEALGVPLRTYQNYERGEREPDLRTLIALVALGWNANWLLTGEGPERLGDAISTSASPGAGLSQRSVAKAAEAVSFAVYMMGFSFAPEDIATAIVALAKDVAQLDEAQQANLPLAMRAKKYLPDPYSKNSPATG